jgi:hypothetical protein
MAPLLGERLLDEAVIGGKHGRGEDVTIEFEPAALLAVPPSGGTTISSLARRGWPGSTVDT